MRLDALAFVLLAGAISCLGNLALKQSRLISDPSAGFFEKFGNLYFVLGLVFYAINLVLFAKALDSAPVSVAYPVLAGSGFAFLAFASAALFHERIGSEQIAGLTLVVIGIALLARSS